MGVSSVNATDSAVRLASLQTAPPSPSRSRTAEAPGSATPKRRDDPGTGEDQVQRSEQKTDGERPAVQQRGVRLRVDEASKRVVAQIVGADNEVIKQIPPEEVLEIASKFRDLQGILFDQNA